MRLLLVLCIVACARPQLPRGLSTDASLVLENGRIFTGDPAHPWTDALAIRGDTIAAIGADARRLNATSRIDLGGKLVIPGINDAHVHEPELLSFVDVAEGFETLTVDQIIAALERATHEQPAGTWLRAELGRIAIDDPQLTKALLDRVSPQHPVWVDNFAGHVVVLNSVAERLLDLPAKAPYAGFLGRENSGADDGWRYEYARYEAMRRIGAKLPDAAIARAMHAFEVEANQLGITTVQTMPLDVDAERLLTAAPAASHTVRWHVMRFPLGAVIQPPRPARLDPAYRVVLTGTKYILDGTPVERDAALIEPYSDHAPWTGRLVWSRDDVREMLEAARGSGDALHVHVAGDRSVALVLDLMTELGGDWRPSRVVLEHGDGLAEKDFLRAQKLGVVVVQNPVHSTTTALDRDRLGDRTKRWMPMRSLIAAHIPFAIGSDGPLDPFLNIMLAEAHPLNPAEAITREQALVAYTQGSAYVERLEQTKGRLVPGMLADLAVLSQDIFSVPAGKLPDTRSVLTIVGGQVVYDAANLASARSSARTE